MEHRRLDTQLHRARFGPREQRIVNVQVGAFVQDHTLRDSRLQIQGGGLSGHSRLPVLFLTSRNEEEDIVAALRAGADDYLTKPPKQCELLARVGALLRRGGFQNEQSEDEDADPYRIDTTRRRVTLTGREISLTEREFELALFLFRRRGRVVSREALLEGVWNIRGDVATRTVDTHVSRLRKKLELGGEHGWRLNAVYQHGYRLEQA